MSKKPDITNNKFRKCYAAAVFAHDATMRRFLDRLSRENIVLMDDIISYSQNEFFAKYRPTDRTKKALMGGLKQMGLQFAD